MSDIDLSEFRDLEIVITNEIDNLSKSDLSEIMHILALQVGTYKYKYGDLPQYEHEAMLSVGKITNEVKEVLVGGMRELLDVIYTVKDEVIEKAEIDKNESTSKVH